MDIDGIVLSEQEVVAILSHFRLSSRKDWLKDVARGFWLRDRFLIVEDDDLYGYAARSGLGIRVALQRPSA